MSLALVTGPKREPITLAEGKDHLRVVDTDSDALILGLITSVREHIDGRDGWLGRALITQTWTLTLDHFPAGRTGRTGYQGPFFANDAIRVPLPPLQSVTSIKYTDTDGAEQTLDASKYKVDTASQPGRIVPAFGEIWPSTRNEIEAVRVQFVCGYGANTANVPRAIAHGMKLILGHWYEHREEVIVGTTAIQMPVAADSLLAPYRVWDFA